jgi:hypothetical protein
MSEFEDAIAWRGPDRLSFIVYGVWRAGGPVTAMERAVTSLKNVVPDSEVSFFVATDADWPCSVGVFDIECDRWPDSLEEFCKQLLAAVCREGPDVAWMMFDGVFNAVKDIFRQNWAPHVYAVLGDCRTERVDLAIADVVRHSAEWAQVLGTHRERVMSLFPTLRSGN